MSEEYRKEYKAFSSDAKWTFWKVVPLMLMGLGIVGALSWGVNLLSQPAKIITKTLNAYNVLYNYEWFKRTNKDVLALDSKVNNAQSSMQAYKGLLGPRKGWDYSDKQELGRLNSVLLGLRNQRRDVIAEYNAKASMANRNIFMGNDLPQQIQGRN